MGRIEVGCANGMADRFGLLSDWEMGLPIGISMLFDVMAMIEEELCQVRILVARGFAVDVIHQSSQSAEGDSHPLRGRRSSSVSGPVQIPCRGDRRNVGRHRRVFDPCHP